MSKQHASLFSGIGRAEIAAQWMGWQNAFHCEIQEFPRRVLEYWFPNSESYEDITKTDFTKWRNRIDVLTGGFPCQPFSLAGRRKGADDNRYLWPHMLARYGRYSPLGSLLKMLLNSSRWYSPLRRLRWDATVLYSKRITYTVRSKNSRPTRSAKVLNTRDIASCRLLFRLVPSERPIGETECGLLPTVMTQGLKQNVKGKTKFYPTELLPTPTALDCGSGRINKSLSPHAAARPTLAMAARMGMLLTPSASDGMRANFTMEALKNHNKKNAEKSNLAEQIAHMIGGGSSLLNPLYVEEMMGFPSMWTTLPFLVPHKPTATHGCRKWLTRYSVQFNK